MSAPMRKHHTNADKQSPRKKQTVLYVIEGGKTYAIPRKVANQYVVSPRQGEIRRIEDIEQTVSSDKVFERLNKRYTKAGALLKGLRAREDMTQKEFANKINVTQANLSLMENGKRVTGKQIAKRIEKAFGVDWRFFL